MFSQIHVWEHKVCYAQLLVKLLQTLLSLVQIKEAMIKRFQMRLFENIKLCLQAKQTQGSSLSPWHGEWILIRIKACVCVCASGDPHTDSFMLPILQHMHTEVNESPALTDRYQQGHLYTVLLQQRIAGRSSNYPGYRVSCQHYIHIKDPNKQQKIHCLYINPPHRLHHPQGEVRGQAELMEHHLWSCLGDDFLCYLSTFCVLVYILACS